MIINVSLLFLLFSIAIAFHVCRAKLVNRSLDVSEIVGICFQEGVCGQGFDCIDGLCHVRSRNPKRAKGTVINRRRSRAKRDTGLYCQAGSQAASFCFPPSFCGTGTGYASISSNGCCGNTGYHCENSRYGNLCCQSNGVIATLKPTQTVPVVPCIGPHCVTLSPYNTPQPSMGFCPSTHIDRGACSPTDYSWCSMTGLGECINGRCCQKMNGPTMPLSQGKMCQNNRCVAGTCQPAGNNNMGVCPVGRRETGPCHPLATNQRCSSTGICYNGKCCEPDYQVQVGQPQVVQQPYNVMPQQSICTPAMCINPYNYLRNNCCRRRK